MGTNAPSGLCVWCIEVAGPSQASSQDLFQGGGQKLIDTRGVARILVRAGKTSDKISSKVARISVRAVTFSKSYSTKTFKKF